MLKRLAVLMLLVAPLPLSGCGLFGEEAPTPREVMMGFQGLFNVTAEAQASYAEQPFCGEVGAPPAPACADPQLVIQMSTYSNDALDALDTGWAAANNVNLDKLSYSSIFSTVAVAIGKFRGIFARHGITVGTPVLAEQPK